MAEALMVKCKVCGRTFPSPVQMDRRAFENAREGNMEEYRESGGDVPEEVVNWQTLSGDLSCPNCGETRSYQKPDYVFGDAGAES